MITNKKWWRAALIRALRTVAQTLAGSIPAGYVITSRMLQEFDVSILWAVLAWLGTGILSGVASLLTSLGGLPEVEDDKGVNAISDGWPVDEAEPGEDGGADG